MAFPEESFPVTLFNVISPLLATEPSFRNIPIDFTACAPAILDFRLYAPLYPVSSFAPSE